MTHDEFTKAVDDGAASVETTENPGASEATNSATETFPIEQFLPILVALQSTQRYLSAAPTFIPQTFQDQIQFVHDGTHYSLYLYFNNQWNQFGIGGGGSSNNGRSHGTGVTSIPATTTVKITFQTNDFANNVTWDGTSYRFVATVAGQYLITGSVGFTNVTDGAVYRIYLYVNGSETSEAQVIPGNSIGEVTFQATDVQNLNVGDYVEVWAFCSPSGGGTISTSQFRTYLAVAQV